MIADEKTRAAIVALVESTHRALSTPGARFDAIFDAPDIAIAGSGLGELYRGPEEVVALTTAAAMHGVVWNADTITVWRRGDVAWAQVLGTVTVVHDGGEEVVPYWTTGVFGLDDGRWRWLYWGGAEPQDPPRV